VEILTTNAISPTSCGMPCVTRVISPRPLTLVQVCDGPCGNGRCPARKNLARSYKFLERRIYISQIYNDKIITSNKTFENKIIETEK